jgi:hypothetical protein
MLLVSSSSQTIPVNFLLFPSITYPNPLFSWSSHQIPFVSIKFSSKSFCSHNFPLFPQLPFVPNPNQPNPTQPNINPQKALNFVRDLGRVLNGAPQFRGRPGSEATVWQADVCLVRQSRKWGFCACQVLWKIAGWSASSAADCRASSFMCVCYHDEWARVIS